MEDYLEVAKMDGVNMEIVSYIAKNIFPRYEKYYSHGMVHINNVIHVMMMLAMTRKLNKDMAYVIACFHDSGLSVDRENHEIESAKIMAEDPMVRSTFSEEEIKTMKEAIEDHRGSRKERPRNIYGECLSDADRDFNIQLLAKRQLATSLKNNPELKTFEEHFEHCYTYICKRINGEGVFNLWTNDRYLTVQRNRFQKDYMDKLYTKIIYRVEWDRIFKDGTNELIMNYYEDY